MGGSQRLTLQERRDAWRIARKSYHDCGGNVRGAQMLLESRFSDAGFDPATILLLIKLALLFLDWLYSHRGTDIPDEPPQVGVNV